MAAAVKPSKPSAKPSASQTLALPGIRELVITRTADIVVTAEISVSAGLSLLAGLQPDLYRCFMERTWSTSSARGIIDSNPPRNALHR